MKLRQLLIALMLCISFTVWGLPSNNTAQNQDQQSRIEQLQKEKEELQEQLVKLDKEVDRYRNDLRDNITHWFSLLTIIIALVAIVIPYLLNSRNEKSMQLKLEAATKQASSAKNQADDAKSQVELAKNQVELAKNQAEAAFTQVELATQHAAQIAEQASIAVNEAKKAEEVLGSIEMLKKEIDRIKEDIDESKQIAKQAAIQAAKEARTNELYNQALAEKDLNRAISKYSEVIETRSNDSIFDSILFRSRGKLREQIGDTEGAQDDFKKASEIEAIDKNRRDSEYLVERGEIYMTMKNIESYEAAIGDFSKALELDGKSIKALLKRAECYRQLAELEQNEQKKEEYLKKAEKDKIDASKL